MGFKENVGKSMCTLHIFLNLNAKASMFCKK